MQRERDSSNLFDQKVLEFIIYTLLSSVNIEKGRNVGKHEQIGRVSRICGPSSKFVIGAGLAALVLKWTRNEFVDINELSRTSFWHE